MHLVGYIILWKENFAGKINIGVMNQFIDIVCSYTIRMPLFLTMGLHFLSKTEVAGGRRCGRYPPEVRTAIPVDGRFEHIVLSCNTTSDHAIIWIEREAEKAVEVS